MARVVTSGAAVSTVNETMAGDWSKTPAAVARTSNVCGPSESAAVVCGEVQPPNSPASTRHWKNEFASEEVNANSGVWSLVTPDGADVIVVSGAPPRRRRHHRRRRRW